MTLEDILLLAMIVLQFYFLQCLERLRQQQLDTYQLLQKQRREQLITLLKEEENRPEQYTASWMN